MNVKKIAVIGVIALVIISFVVAAGCTASVNSQSTTTKTATDGTVTITTNDNGNVTSKTFNINDLVGTWEGKDNSNQLLKFLIKSDNSGIRYLTDTEGKEIESPFTWEAGGEGIIMHFKDTDGEDVSITVKLSDDKKSLIDVNGLVIVKS